MLLFKGSRLLQNHFVEQTESTGDILVLNDNRRNLGRDFSPKMSSAKIPSAQGKGYMPCSLASPAHTGYRRGYPQD